MSRTYKDRPSHVIEGDPKFRKKARAKHRCGHKAKYTYDRRMVTIHDKFFGDLSYMSSSISEVWVEVEECDLNEAHERQGRYTHTKTCEYIPYFASWWYYEDCGMTKSDRKFFWDAARNERHKKTKEMVAEYNTCGILEDDYVFTPYKKNAVFGGGYID